MSKLLKVTLIVHVVLAGALGLALLGMPGRFLSSFGWAPVDPLISRILGAALLSMAWLDVRALRSNSHQAAQPAIEIGTVFCGLTCAGLLWHIKGSYWPWMVWIVLATFIILTGLWLWNWIKK